MKKSNSESKKTNKKKVIIGLIILMLVIILIVIVVLINRKSLNIEDEIVTNAYNYVGNNDLGVCAGLAIYADEAVEYDDLENAMRICNAYSLLDLDETSMIKIDKTQKNNTCSIGENITFATDNYEDDICTVTKVSSDEINNKYKEMYGKSIETYEQFQYNDATICYYEDGFYYCGLAESYTTTIGGEPHTYRSIKNATENNDELIIYDYFLKIVNDKCYTSFTGDKTNDTCSENFTEEEDMTYNFLKEYGTLYKHTFKKSGDSYYWVKSEPAN